MCFFLGGMHLLHSTQSRMICDMLNPYQQPNVLTAPFQIYWCFESIHLHRCSNFWYMWIALSSSTHTNSWFYYPIYLCLSYYIHFGTTFQTFYFHQFSHTWTPTHVMFSLILFSMYEFFLVDNLSECHTYISNVSVIDNYANMCRNSLLFPLLISSNEVHVPLRTPSLVWPAGSFCVLTHWSSLPSCLVQFALVVQMVLYELAVWCHQLEPLPSQSSASLYTSRLLLFRRCCDNVGAAAQLLR